MNDSLFKIFRPIEWHTFQNTGVFGGSPHDIRDGFIHMCAGPQLASTLAKHFIDVENIVLARFDPNQLDGLKWEIARGAEKFPHIYGQLVTRACQDHLALQKNESGMFDIRAEFLETL